MSGDRTPLILSPQELHAVAKAMDLLAGYYRDAAEKIKGANPAGIKVKSVKTLAKVKVGLITCAGAIQEALLEIAIEHPAWERMENADADPQTTGQPAPAPNPAVKSTAKAAKAETSEQAKKKRGAEEKAR